MHTGITGTTRTLFGRPYMVYPTEHLPHTQQFHNIQQQNNNHPQKYGELFHQIWNTHVWFIWVGTQVAYMIIFANVI